MSDEFEIGQLIEGTPYKVVQRIGKGGMGSVYEVEHRELGKRFVLKALLREFISRPDLVQRLRNEWRALGKLEHPNIVSVTDAGVAENRVPYYVMERLVGETLAHRIRDWGRMPPEEALEIAAGVLDGLSAAHAIGVVHRDVKPPNIFLTSSCPKVLDFGIAKLLDGTAPITSRGVAIGTPRYISPEQASGDSVDARADLYAVGLLLYEMLSGESPFEDCKSEELLISHLTKVPARLATLVPGIPSELDHLVARLLEKKPGDRPPSAQGAADTIRAIARGLAGPAVLEDTLASPFSGALTPMALPVRQSVVPPTLREGGSRGSLISERPVSGDAPTVPAEERHRGSRPPVRGAHASPISDFAPPTTPTELLDGGQAEDVPPTRTAVPGLGGAEERSPSMPPWGISTPAAGRQSRSFSILAAVAGFLGAAAVLGGVWLAAPGFTGEATAAAGPASPRDLATDDKAGSKSAERAQPQDQRAEESASTTPPSDGSGSNKPKGDTDANANRLSDETRSVLVGGVVDRPNVETSPPNESADSTLEDRARDRSRSRANDARAVMPGGITDPWRAGRDGLGSDPARSHGESNRRESSRRESSERGEGAPERGGASRRSAPDARDTTTPARSAEPVVAGRRLPGSGIPGL